MSKQIAQKSMKNQPIILIAAAKYSARKKPADTVYEGIVT